MKKLSIILGLLMIANICSATVINIPSDYSTIQAGIDAAVNGDTVLVADGTYTGTNNKNLTWDGNMKHITVKSQNGPASCIIDCEQDGRAFYLNETYQDTNDVIEGFTIKNGLSSSGSGIYCDYASPIIQKNTISDNIASHWMVGGSGGGISCYNSTAIIRDNIIKQNEVISHSFPSFVEGGGIYVYYGAPIIKNNIILENELFASDMECIAGGAGLCSIRSSAKIVNNLIAGNIINHQFAMSSIGGGIYSHNIGDNITFIENNTIIDNYGKSGGGVFINEFTIMKNNILVYNLENGIKSSDSVSCTIRYNDIWNNGDNFVNCPAGIGDTSWGFNNNNTPCDSCYNITENPLFVAGSLGDYFLSQMEAGQNQESPCVDAGDSSASHYGMDQYTTRTDLQADENIVDMGFHYSQGNINSVLEDNNGITSKILINYPNPFINSTNISCAINKFTKNKKIIIYNLKGQKIKELNSFSNSSNVTTTWDGTNMKYQKVASGIYFMKLLVDDKTKAIRKMLKLD